MLVSIYLTGVGGQGVVTMANLIADHLARQEMKVTLIHATGMAQRGGRVTSEIRFSDTPSRGFGPRVSAAGADFMIGMDMAETINSLPFMKPAGILIFSEYTLVPSQVILKKERFPDGGEVERLFTGAGARIARIEKPGKPANLFTLGVFMAVCGRDGGVSGILDPAGFEKTLQAALTKRLDENLAAYRAGVEFGGDA